MYERVMHATHPTTDDFMQAGFVQKNVAFSSGALKYAINEEQASRLVRGTSCVGSMSHG